MMGVVKELTDILPAGYTALEDEDFLTLRCDWCGEEVMFSSGGPETSDVQVAAMKHSAICVFRHRVTR